MNSKNKTKKTEIVLIQDGPMIVTGPFEIVDSNGKHVEIDSQWLDRGVALCRCGRSASMPLCDGSHLKHL